MQTQAPPDEWSPGSGSIRGDHPSTLGSGKAANPRAAPRCPRCGGPVAPPRGLFRRSVAAGRVVCERCGWAWAPEELASDERPPGKARKIRAARPPAGFRRRLVLALVAHVAAGLGVGGALGFYLLYAAEYYQSRGVAGERAAPPNDAATHAYLTVLWTGAGLWAAALPAIVGLAWWTRERRRQWALLAPLAWAALWIALAIGLTYYGAEIAGWE